MAVPHVAGAAALYLEGNPWASPFTVNSHILSNPTPNRLSGVPWGTPNLLLYTLDPPSTSRTAIARTYNPNNGDHMYGFDAAEGSQYGYYSEGYPYFYLLQSPAGSHVPLYRMYNSSLQDTFYTVDWGEADYAANWYGYQHQGVIGYVYLTP
jgi:hypothetical protein